MASKKPSSAPFTTLRILGAKARQIIAKARAIRESRSQEKAGSRHAGSAPMPEVRIHFSLPGMVTTTLVIVAIALGVIFLYFLREAVVLLILGFFVAAILDPGIKAMKRIGIPRGVAIILQYFVALFLIVFLLISLIPIIADQIQQIATFLQIQLNAFLASPTINFPFFSDAYNLRLTAFAQVALQDLSVTQFATMLQQIGHSLSGAAEGSVIFAAQIAGSVVSFFMKFFVVLVLAFFLQMEKEKTIAWLRSFLPPNVRSYVDDRADRIHWKLAQWARGQLLLSSSAFVLVFLALVVMRMPYALTLAIFAGFTELVPVLGMFIAAFPALLIGITQQGFLWGILLACIYYVIQWCEGNLIVPLVMEHSVGLSPIAVILAMLVGMSFPSIIHPVLGIMLSIPAAAALSVFFEDWQDRRIHKPWRRIPS